MTKRSKRTMAVAETRKRNGPGNSLGQPWQPGQRWTCTRCDDSGDDRDDMRLSLCSADPHGIHALRFEPEEHAAAIAARQLGLPGVDV